MKLSIAWIFDHINADWQKQDIQEIMKQFNQKTAEIEGFEHYSLDLTNLVLNEVNGQPEKAILINTKENRPATYADLNIEREGLLPLFDATDKTFLANWKKNIETKDVILEVDNKSITHRPDMWGHRGFAREIASFLNLSLIPQEELLAKQEIKQFNDKSEGKIHVENKVPKACLRFSTLYFDSIDNKPSNLFMALRLARVGTKPINSIVDLTNYTMLDWSQPMHAFDSQKISGKKIIVRCANKNESLELLDDSKLSLTDNDLVIANDQKAMSLAGVMGGKDCSIANETNSILLESAAFDAATIRHSASHHKIRTDSSARFEKTLDPNQVIDAILRFLKVAQEANIKYTINSPINILGNPLPVKTIKIEHEYFEKKAGFKLEASIIKKLLEKIEFKVKINNNIYEIEAPSFRAAKDIKAKEDILEEVVRLYGFEKIIPTQPVFLRYNSDLSKTMNLRKIKHYLASGANMMEQKNYSFYDEDFLKQLKFDPAQNTKLVEVLSPVSENYKRLTTSLIPHLLKNIRDNFLIEDKLYFFEFGRTWQIDSSNNGIEKRTLSGIFFHKRENIDFYQFKYLLNKVFEILGISEKISWGKSETIKFPWQNQSQTANISFENQIIGYAGTIDKTMLSNIDTLPQSDAFIFELDGDFLITALPVEKIFSPLSKFQESSFDLSFVVPINFSVKEIETLLSNIDPLIENIKLIDFFEKEDWLDKRALTFRVQLVSMDKTLDKESIELVRQKAINLMAEKNIVLR